MRVTKCAEGSVFFKCCEYIVFALSTSDLEQCWYSKASFISDQPFFEYVSVHDCLQPLQSDCCSFIVLLKYQSFKLLPMNILSA